MPTPEFPPDRFDDVPDVRERVGAHRAENPRLRGGLVFLWAAIATVLLIAVGIVVTMILSGRLALAPSPSETPVPTATTAAVVDPAYSVLVLNATGQAGLAAAAKKDLVAAGWTDSAVYTADAATKDFAQTTVYYAFPEDEAAARGLAGLLGGADVAQNTQYQQDEDPATKQLVVVLGLDRTASATP